MTRAASSSQWNVRIAEPAKHTLQEIAQKLASDHEKDQSQLSRTPEYVSLISLINMMCKDLPDNPMRYAKRFREVITIDGLGWRLVAHIDNPKTVVIDYIDIITNYAAQDQASSIKALTKNEKQTYCAAFAVPSAA